MYRWLLFFRLVRFSNLLFIVGTQSLLHYCIVLPVFQTYGIRHAMSHLEFWLLVLSTVFIAAAGYVINDYFDLQTDRVNKPYRITIGLTVSRRWAMVWHMIFNGLGILLGIYVSYRINMLWLAGFHFFSVALLWFYSTTFKHKVLIGNILVSFLIALVVGLVVLYDAYHLLEPAVQLAEPEVRKTLFTIFIFGFTYATFAFVINMIREIVKDMEDIKGDSVLHSATLPLTIGLRHSKWVVYVLTLVLVVFIGFLQVLEVRNGNLLIVIYALLAVQGPLIYMNFKLHVADRQQQFGVISKMIKYIMLAGVLSMFLIYLFYNPANYI